MDFWCKYNTEKSLCQEGAVKYFAFRENTSYIYLNVCIEFIPMILVVLDKISFPLLAMISCIMGIINILILLIFDGSNFKEDIRKKLHV